MSNIAIFSTSNCLSAKYDKNDSLIEAQASETLLRALREGYTIYVITTRTEFGEHDQCWLQHIPKENVFQPTKRVKGGNDTQMIALWRELFQKLGLNAPSGIWGEDNWVHWKYAAGEQGILV